MVDFELWLGLWSPGPGRGEMAYRWAARWALLRRTSVPIVAVPRGLAPASTGCVGRRSWRAGGAAPNPIPSLRCDSSGQYAPAPGVHALVPEYMFLWASCSDGPPSIDRCAKVRPTGTATGAARSRPGTFRWSRLMAVLGIVPQCEYTSPRKFSADMWRAGATTAARERARGSPRRAGVNVRATRHVSERSGAVEVLVKREVSCD